MSAQATNHISHRSAPEARRKHSLRIVKADEQKLIQEKSRKRLTNIQTYLEREGVWEQPKDALETMDSLKRYVILTLAMRSDTKTLDRMLEAAHINPDPNQRILVHLYQIIE